jgi:hypothetical protein
MLIKKIAAGVFLGAGLLVLAGCGANPSPNNGANTNSPSASTQNKPTNQPVADQGNVPQNLPPATGNISDTVNAIQMGADSEKTQATSDANDAKSAVDNGTDTNNLNNIYDQNSL